MIKEVRIKCFQSHEDTVLVFGSGINIIVGEGNDIGKTALFRAIRWPIDNRPLGDGFVSNFQDGPASVELITDDAHVKRIKGPKENRYILTSGEFVEEEFKAFGTNPPEPVKDALNFLDVNIQKQLSLPFLVLDSPGQVAQHIRDIANLDDIDKVISLLKSKARMLSDQLAVHNKNVEKIDEELAGISKIDIKRFELLLMLAAEVRLDNQDISTYIQSLSSLITNLCEIENNWIKFPADIEDILEDASCLLSSNEKQSVQIDNLNILIQKLRKIEQQAIVLPADIGGKITALNDAELQYNNTVEKIVDLSSLLRQLRRVDERITEIRLKENLKQEQFDDLLEQLVSCPMCSNKLTDKTKEHLLKEYKE